MSAFKNCLLVPADAHNTHGPEAQTVFATAPSAFPIFPTCPAFPDSCALSDSNDSDDSNDAALHAANARVATEESISAATDAAIRSGTDAAVAQAASLVHHAQRRHASPQTCSNVPRKRGRPKRFLPQDTTETDLNGPGKRGRPKTDLLKRDLFRFFCKLRRLEHHIAITNNPTSSQYAQSNLLLTTDQLATEFLSQSAASKYHYTHMYELWCLYQRQQIPLLPPINSSRDERTRRNALLSAFFTLKPPAQKQLVDDWLVERTARQRERHAEALETCLARRVLIKLKSDLLVLANNIDYVLRDNIEPQRWQSIFSGI
jgi:hypothetical protein